jgi:hypothetical protein
MEKMAKKELSDSFASKFIIHLFSVTLQPKMNSLNDEENYRIKCIDAFDDSTLFV